MDPPATPPNKSTRARSTSYSSPSRPKTSILVDTAPQVSITHKDGVTHIDPVPNSTSPPPVNRPRNSDVRPTADELTERLQTLIDGLLLRFKNFVALVPIPGAETTKEEVAAQNFQMEVEAAALVRNAEDLLVLNRELKELWLFGPLRELGEGEDESKMAEDAEAVAKMAQEFINATAKATAEIQAAANKKAADINTTANKKA